MKPHASESSRAFASPVVDRARKSGNVLEYPGGQILLPKVFGFCRGVVRALAMLQQAIARKPKRLFLLGEIIHNPWVNNYFREQGVRLLSPDEIVSLESCVTGADCAVVPAFGVLPEVQRRLEAIGCEIVDGKQVAVSEIDGHGCHRFQCRIVLKFCALSHITHCFQQVCDH